MLTVSASEARANFSQLGEKIVQTGEPVTVFKNSRPWLVIAPAGIPEKKNALLEEEGQNLTGEEQALLEWSDSFVMEYRDVFEALAK